MVRIDAGRSRVMVLSGDKVLGRGVYGAMDTVRLVNFLRRPADQARSISPNTLSRWMHGDDYATDKHSDPLWHPDYRNADNTIEVSFRDLIELRFVKAFRDVGLSLTAIRECFKRAVEEVRDDRPFSTRRFRTDGRTIFLEITDGVEEGDLLDLRSRQKAFHRIMAPSFRDLEFDADSVARWYPLGFGRKSIVVDPSRSFGRPVTNGDGVPTQILFEAVKVEKSMEQVAELYEVPLASVRDAIAFQKQLLS